MKKLTLLFALFGCLCHTASAQLTASPSPKLYNVSMSVTKNTSTQKCYYMKFQYTCPAGNCTLQIAKFDTSENTWNSGAPNTYLRSWTGTVCFDKTANSYSSVINCRAGTAKDGCVVVIEGGG